MKRALLALGLAMASVSVPLAFAQKTPLPQAKKATHFGTKKAQHKAHKPGYAARHGKNSPAPNGARKSQGFEE
jgi:hypothetical protein